MGLRWAWLPAVLLLAGCSGLFFFPEPGLRRTPAELGLHHEDVRIPTTEDREVHGWWLPAATEAPLGAVFYLHGNAENISTHIHNVAWLPEQGYGVFLMDYRGFGLSTGRPSVEGAIEDARFGLRWLLAQPGVAQGPVFLLGQSIGGAVALYLVGTEADLNGAVTAVVSDGAFSQYSQIAREASARSWLLWPLQWPIGWAMANPADPVEVVERVSPTPLLLIHSGQDPVIPVHHGARLFARALAPKCWLQTRGPHTATFAYAPYRAALLEFFACAVSAPGLGGCIPAGAQCSVVEP
ncbi:MAG: alpha/beta fold hydrolase [Pseudomonadota bacterium]|nr:alpha/beta fold hydrolase [Pseudomonadota bacterium]